LPAISDLPIYNTLMANRTTVLLSVAVSLGLFDKIHSQNTMSATQMATDFGFSLRGVDAVLVGLKALKLLDSLDTQEPQDWYSMQYKLTELSMVYLLTSSEFYLGHLIEMDAESFLTPKGLLEALKKDKPAVYGSEDPWDHQESKGNEAAAERFTLGMRSISIAPAVSMSKDVIFSDRRVLLDVGGGSGVHLAKIIQANPQLQGILLDIPSVFKTTEPYFERERVLDKIDCVRLNMFKDPWTQQHSTGAPVDCILLSQILHDWPVARGYDLLKSAFETLSSGGKVIIHEKLLDDQRTGPVATAMVSLDMIFWTEGQQYTKQKLFDMLKETGFVDCGNRATIGYWSITYATKP
jgi:hypothetical protein